LKLDFSHARTVLPDSFDPYFEWLGIETAGQPPDHYRLLSLTYYEPDPELISRAADAAMAQVRRVRPGQHLTEWSRLLDHLTAAKTCLLDPASKRAYDQCLGGQSSALPVPDAWSVPTAAPVPEGSPIAVGPAPITAPAAASSGTGLIIMGVVILVAVAGGVLVYTKYQHETSAVNNSGAGAARVRPAETAAPRDSSAALRRRFARNTQPGLARLPEASGTKARTPLPPSRPIEPPASPSNSTPETPDAPATEPQASAAAKPESQEPKAAEPEAEKPKPTVDATMAAAFAQAVANARAAMAQRNLAAATRHANIASSKAQTPEDRDQVDRIKTMLDNLTQFWNGIRGSMAKLRPVEELALGDTRIVVVESGRDRLTIKDAGRIRRFQATTMPTPLVMALADQFFGKDPGSKAIIGTFLAVDPSGDRALARQYWEEAARAGIDAQKLLPELDAASSGGGRKK
jgi:hypothetical protein